ncbi:hypothetical protein N2152v2_005208 [Parachlorella kessleri]
MATWSVLPAVPGAQGQYLSGIANSKHLKKAIYTELRHGDACVRLLHASGSIGCAAPSRDSVEGVLVRVSELQSPDAYPDAAVFVVQPDFLDDFLLSAAADPTLQRKVQAVLVEAGTPANFSPAPISPLAEYALYPERGYQWNPQGTGLSSMAFPFPVFLLDNDTTASAQLRAQYNADRGMSGAVNVARMELAMDAGGNSSACLAARTCLPLGGHSVLAALPPLPAQPVEPQAGVPGVALSAAQDGKPLILLLASTDTTAFFHEKAQGANAPVSGLIAVLAAAQILGMGGGAGDFTRRVLFGALAGETWGYMGSKRMLWEMASGNASMAGIDLASVETVLEVRQVGRAMGPDGVASFFMHHRKGHNNTLPLWRTVQAAAANTTEVPVSIERASDSTPGLPPSSVNSFLRVGSDSIRGAVIEDFDTEFKSATFESNYDTVDTINASSIEAAALLVARAVHVLALGDTPPFPPLPVNYTRVQQTVAALIACLLGDLGLRCPLAAALMSPVSGGTVQHYISILRTITEDPQTADTASKKDVERFVWNFLAFATAGIDPLDGIPPSASRCQPYDASACPRGAVCAGYRSMAGDAGKGVCLNTTVRYVPSYSTSLECQGCNGSATLGNFGWQVTTAAQQWEQQYGWPPDPLYTESNWPYGTPHLELFLKDTARTDWAVMVAGLCVSAVAGLAALATHAAYEKRLKQS